MTKSKREPKERDICRSNHYQHLILEAICSHDMMEAFSNHDSISHRLNPFEYDEELAELEEQLRVEFWRVVGETLTERQKIVIQLYSEGKTQMEIAKELGVNQSSITKCLHGNCDYSNSKRVYGGSIKKIKKIIETDEKILSILDKIRDLRNEKW